MATISWIRARVDVRRTPRIVRPAATVVACTLLCATPASAAPAPTVAVNGVRLATSRVVHVSVDQLSGTPDAATVHVVPRSRSPIRPLDSLVITGSGGGADAVIFEGEIVGIKPLVDPAGQPVIVLRAFNRLHRLTRDRKTRVFENAADSDIVKRIAIEHGLAPHVEGAAAAETHREIAQLDQTDLEFLRARAEAIGFDLDADGLTLRYRPRPDGKRVALGCPPRYRPDHVVVHALRVRLASARQVQRVIVRGWDPDKKVSINGSAQGPTIDLSRVLDTAAPLVGQTVDLGSVDTLATPASTHGTAKGTLDALTATDVAVEVATDGTAGLRAGGNAQVAGLADAFNGKYLVTSVTHRYTRGRDGGDYVTLVRLVRADRGLYVLPEVGDEVIVGFEHGDVRRPIVLGSLWNDPAKPQESACGPASTRE